MMKSFTYPSPQTKNRWGRTYLSAVCSYLLAAVLLLGHTAVHAQTCTPGPGLAHWSFDEASDMEIDAPSGIPSSGGGPCVGKLLRRTDGGANSTYVTTVGNVDSDYGPVCGGKKSICTNNWDNATPFVRYISVMTTFDKGIKGKVSGIAFCELALARTKSGGGFSTNNSPENYQVRLRKRINGGSWSVVWTGSVKSTTKKDWTGTSSNPVPPSVWGTYNSSTDGFTTQTTNGTSTVDFEFQISAFQNTNSSSSREVWDLDEVDIAGCCESLPCTPTSELVQWNFDNASDNQIDNTSGIPATGGSYTDCASVLLKRTDGGNNSVYTNSSSSADYGPVCASNKSICTGTWDSATPFDRYITTRVTFPSGKAGRLYGISFCEMTMNKTKSGGSFVTNNQPENYRVRLLRNGSVIWTGSVKSTTKTTWTSATNTPPSGWGNYNSNTDGFPVQTTTGASQVVFEFQISAYQSTNSSSAQEVWDLDEITVYGCCDEECVTPATPTGNDAARCGPGTVNLTAGGCVGGTLNWYGTATGDTPLGTGNTFTTPSLAATTTYYVSCLSGLCESGRDQARAIVNPIPATPTAPDVDRCGPGTVTLTATGCTGGTLVWNSAPTGGSILGQGTPFTTTSLTATTTYYVSCSLSTGCVSGRDPAMAAINPRPVANAGGDVVTCSGVGVTLSGTATSGTPAYTYSWAPVSGLSSSTVRNPTATPTATTTYTLTVTDSKGCTSTDVVRVTVNPKPGVVVSADVAVCAGASTPLNGMVTSGTAPYTYTWSPAAGLSSATILNPVATPTGTTIYTLTVTDANGCKDSDVVRVTVNPKPVVSMSPAVTVCAGSGTVLTATASSGTPAYTYNWLPATGLSATNVANPSATPTATTTYTVTVTDSKGCVTTGSVHVTVNSLPTTPSSQSFSNVCPVTTVSLASLIVAGQELYTTNTHSGNPLTVSQVSSLTASGTYYLFRVSNDCYSLPATIKVTVVNCNCVNNPTAIAGTDRVVCIGSAIPLTGASIGGGATQAQWTIVSGGGTLSNTAFVANPSTVSYTPGANTTAVTLRLTTNDPDAGGFCTPAVDEVVITFSRPTIVVGDQTICTGSSVVLNASPSGGTTPYTYAWSPGTGLSSTTVVSPTAAPTATTTYTVVATDANGCRASDVSVVTVNPKPSVNVGADVSLCTGGSTPISASVSGGTGPFTYAWSPASGLSNAAILNPVATPAATTSYTLTVTDSKGCFGTDAVQITVNPKPVANAGADVALCTGSTVILSGTATSGTPAYTYAWSPATGLSNAAIRNPVANPTATTTYTLTVTDSRGCIGTDVVLVTVNPKPVVDAGAPLSLCAGSADELMASVSGGTTPYTYAWSPSAGLSDAAALNPIATPTATTTYTLTVTDSKGCVSTDIVLVTVNPLPTVVASTNVTICTGASTPLSSTVTGGTPAYTYSWAPATGLSATNISNPIATPTATTTYTLTVTDSKGCSRVAVVRVTVNPKPVVDAGAGGNLCAGSSIGLTGAVSGGTIPYTYAWTPATGLSNATILNPTATPATTTSYTLTATDSRGCSATDVVVIGVQSCTQPCGLVELLVTPGPCNPTTNQYSISRTISLTNTVAGILTVTDGAKSTTVAVTASMTSVAYTLSGLPSGSGSHTVVATLAGCGTISATYVAPASCSVCTTDLTTTSLANGQVGTAYSQTLTTTGGAMPYTYTVLSGTLPAGLTLNPVTGVLSGTPTAATTSSFAIKVTDSKSCTDVAALRIITSAAPVCSLSVTANPGTCNPATNTYAVTGTVTATNTTGNQSLTISVGGVRTTVNMIGNGPVSYTLAGLVSDGLTRTVSVLSSATACGTASVIYTAPIACTVCSVSLVTTSLPKGKVGVAYSQTLTAAGGTAPYSFSVAAGTLPNGLTLNPNTGVLSGTPTISGNFPTTLVITDARGCFVRVPLSVIQIDAGNPVLAIVVNSPVCNSATNTYVATGTVSLTNAVTGTLTITDNGQPAAVINVIAGQTSAGFSLTGISNGPAVQLVTASIGTLTASTTYTTPTSCTSGAPDYAIVKTVNQNRVEKGGIVTYTISLTNTGTVTGTNIVVGDQLSSTDVTFIGSATVSTGTFLPAGNSGNWSIASLGAGQVATLSFQVQINEEGLTYNTATAPNGHTVTACLTVPIHVCANTTFEVELSAPDSYSTYQWSRNGVPIPGATSSIYTATAVGEYTVATTNTAGCADGSCCPVVIVSDAVPSLTAVGVAATCTGATPLSDAKITLVGSSTNAVSYNVSMGSSFSAPLFASNQPLADVVSGVLLSNQANPDQAPGSSYTIRVYAANGCYSDTVVVIPPAQCQCPPVKCAPFVVRKTTRR